MRNSKARADYIAEIGETIAFTEKNICEYETNYSNIVTLCSRTLKEISSRNTTTIYEHKLLLQLREDSGTTVEEKEQLDDLLDSNFYKYVFK